MGTLHFLLNSAVKIKFYKMKSICKIVLYLKIIYWLQFLTLKEFIYVAIVVNCKLN